jgi:hypothetical protein
MKIKQQFSIIGATAESKENPEAFRDYKACDSIKEAKQWLKTQMFHPEGTWNYYIEERKFTYYEKTE